MSLSVFKVSYFMANKEFQTNKQTSFDQEKGCNMSRMMISKICEDLGMIIV